MCSNGSMQAAGTLGALVVSKRRLALVYVTPNSGSTLVEKGPCGSDIILEHSRSSNAPFFPLTGSQLQLWYISWSPHLHLDPSETVAAATCAGVCGATFADRLSPTL